MNNQGNIFDGLVTNERTYTELFRNMCRYRFFRDTFARFVTDGSAQDRPHAESALSGFSFQSAQVETQLHSENSGTYPDVVIDTGELRLVIEMKTNTWTGFQDSQPDTYLEDLAKHGAEDNHHVSHKGLIVLIPKYHSHKRSIEDKIVEHRKASGNRPFILLLYWEDFIQQLEDAGARELNSVFRDYLDLSNDWFVNGRITLNPVQISTLRQSMGTALFSLRALVEVIRARLSGSDHIKLSRLKMTDYDFGFSISDTDKMIGYFGIANYAWIHGPSPLLIGVHPLYSENLDTSGLLPGEDEDGLHYWGLPRRLLTGTNVVDEIASLVATTFGVEQSGSGEAEEQVQFDEAALDSLFNTTGAPSPFQGLIRTLEQVGVAVSGNVSDATVEKPVSRWEHSLYFSVGGDEVAGVGIFFSDWAEKGLPLWVGLPESNQNKLSEPVKKGWISDHGYPEPGYGGDGSWEYRPVVLDRLSKDENLVEFVLKLLQSLGLVTDQGL